MFFYDMDSRGDLSLYEYLYRCIRHDIAHGTIKPGQKLPSKRTLAKQLGVSLITIEAAYEQLAAEGYIRSRQRCGYYACDLAPVALVQREGIARAQETGATSHTAIHGVAQGRQANADADDEGNGAPEAPTRPSSAHEPAPDADGAQKPPLLADFTHSTLATRMLPYPTWAKAVRRTLADESAASLAEAASAAGSHQLRQAIADHLREFRGMDVTAEQVVIGAGSQTLYQLLVQLLGRNRVYAIEDPGYPLLTSMYQQQDATISHIPLDGSGINMAALGQSEASVAHVMPSHQFPTGIVTTAARRRELLNWAREGDRYIIEDDYDSEFRMAGRPIPSLFSIDAADRVLYINSFAKSLGAAFRMAYLVLPPQLAKRFRSQLGFYANTVSPLDQLALARFIKQGHYERHVNRLRTNARKTQDALAEALRNAFGDAVELQGLDNGLHLIMGFESARSEKDLVEAAFRHGVRLAPISDFRETPYDAASATRKSPHGKPQARFIVRSDSISTDEVEETVSALAKAWA